MLTSAMTIGTVKFCLKSRLKRACLSVARAGLLGIALLAQPAAAQVGPLHPFELRLLSANTWDANVFRLPASAPDPQLAQGHAGKADRYNALTLGLRFDKSYAQQHFLVDLSRTETHYDKFNSLDRNSLSKRAQWDWRLGSRLSGVLSTDRYESVVGFEDTAGTQQIVTSTTNRNFSADWWMTGGWHLLAGLSELERKNSASFAASPSTSQTGGNLGLRYMANSGNTVTFATRSNRGTNSGQVVDLVNFIDSGFTMREAELNGTWIASAASTLNARLTRIERRHEHVPQRDFSRYAGELGYAWTPTGKLSFNAFARRNVVPWTADTNASFRVDDTLSFAPSWQIASHTTLRMSASRLTNSFLGPVIPIGPSRRDVTRSLLVGADWLPHRSVTLSASWRRDHRSSTDAAFQFDDTVVTVNAALKF